MAEQPNARRSSAGQMTWLWMLLSLIMVSGFLVWLSASSKPSSVAVVEEQAPEEQPTAEVAGAVLVALGDLAGRVDEYRGQTIRLEGVSVASNLGAQAFWTTLPANGNSIPFLVRLDPTLVGNGVTVQSGETLTVVGRVVAMSDSVLTAWTEQGVLADEGQKMEAEFATSFLEAVQVERPAAGSQ